MVHETFFGEEAEFPKSTQRRPAAVNVKAVPKVTVLGTGTRPKQETEKQKWAATDLGTGLL